MFWVWRREDGYISATAYNPFPASDFKILLTTEDWQEAKSLIESERKAAGHPADGWIWERE